MRQQLRRLALMACCGLPISWVSVRPISIQGHVGHSWVCRQATLEAMWFVPFSKGSHLV